MNGCQATSFNRRYAVGAALATAAGLATSAGSFAAPIRGRALTQRGMLGGGTLALPESEAVFSVFASRLTVFDEETEIVVGSFQWVEFPSALTLSSIAVTGYETIPSTSDTTEVRRISGTLSVNGEGEYPFVIEVTDAGAPGNGGDAVSLRAGVSVEDSASATPSAGFRFDYQASGVITGDVQDVDFDFDLDAGTGVVAAGEDE